MAHRSSHYTSLGGMAKVPVSASSPSSREGGRAKDSVARTAKDSASADSKARAAKDSASADSKARAAKDSVARTVRPGESRYR